MIKSSLILECQKQIQRIKFKSIYFLQSQDGVTSIHIQGNKKLSCCHSLKDLEQQLSTSFIRINRNVIVNLRYMVSYHKVTGHVLLENGSELPVSRRNVPQLVRQIALDE